MKKLVQTAKSLINPSLTDQRAALAARHEKSKASRAELRSRCDALAIDGGNDFAAACAEYAAAQVKLDAEASALAKLDHAIAEEEAARAAAERKAQRDEAAAILQVWKENAIELRKELVPLIVAVRDLAVKHDATGVAHANRMVSGLVDPALLSLFIPSEAPETFEVMLAHLQNDDGDGNDVARRVLGFTPPAGLAPIE